MSRLLLRLLLILSLVLNGMGTPWATSAAPTAPGGMDQAATSHDESGGAALASDCHHGIAADMSPGMDHAVHGRAAGDPVADHACCGDAQCTCGCMLPPILGRFAATLSVLRWNLAPVVEPPTRAAVRHRAPPFRPPAV